MLALEDFQKPSYKIAVLANLDKGAATSKEIFTCLSSQTPLKILKVSLKNEVDNQNRSQSASGAMITPEEGFNDVLSHPFLRDFVFKERIPISYEKSSQEGGIEVLSEEDRELNEQQDYLSFMMKSFYHKAKNDTKGLFGERERVEKFRAPKKGSKSLQTFKERERVEIELWVSPKEEEQYENKKIFVNNNPCFLRFRDSNSNTNGKEEVKKEESVPEKRRELKIIGLNKQFERTHAKLEDLDFGELIPEDETLFNSLFSLSILKSAWKELGIPGADNIQAEFHYSGKEKSKSQKLFILIPLCYGFEMKIEFSYKFCKEVRFEKSEDSFVLYAKLLIPPRIYLQSPNKASYETPSLRLQWPRVHNFFVIDNPFIDEVHKTYMMNNSVLRMKFPSSSEGELKAFQAKLKAMNIHKKRTKGSTELLVADTSRVLLTEEIFNGLDFSDPNQTFNIKYALLCLLSEKRISIYDPDVLDTIKQLSKSDFEPEIIASTLEDLCKRLERSFFSSSQGEIWNIFKALLKRKRRSRGLESKASLFHILRTRKVSLTPSGVIYGLPEPEMSNRVLRRFENELDLFLRVKLADDDLDDTKNMKFVIFRYFKPKMEAFNILGRRYHFLAFSASQLRNTACWMFANEKKGITAEEIVSSLGKFNDKIPAKKAARIGQSFSASFPVVLTQVKPNINCVDDIEGKEGVFSDGIGQISSDLMKMICVERNLTSVDAIQIRFGGAKGVLAVNPELKTERTILLRDSMIKFDGKYQDLEILDYNKYRAGYLNRQIILLLISLKIDPNVFRELQTEYLESLKNCNMIDATIFQYFNAEYDGQIMDLPPITHVIRRMMNAGFSLKGDPFITGIERTLRLRGLLLLKKKSNILVKKAARLLGVLDEYGVLGPDEVCVRVQYESDGKIERAQWIEGEVMVTRNPCLHPGDIRVLKAVKQQRLAHFTNCVVFNTKGERPVTSMISGGDLDGDLYFVTWDKRLIPKNTCPALSYQARKPNIEMPSSEITLQQMLDFFTRYMTFDNLGRIANNHLALADQSPALAFDERCIKLSELHSEAVDFVKTGYCPEKIDSSCLVKEWPDFMEKKDYLLIYESKTVLGELYREIKQEIRGRKENGEFEVEKTALDYDLDLDLVYGAWEEHIQKAVDMYDQFQQEMIGLISLYSIRNEFEVYSGNFSKFTKEERKGRVNVEILQKRVLDSIIVLKQKYLAFFMGELYGKPRKELEPEQKEALKSRASAVYITSYLNLQHEKNPKYSEKFRKVFEYKKWRFFEENTEKIIGMPWMVIFDWLEEIKILNTRPEGKKPEEESKYQEEPIDEPEYLNC